MDHGDVSNPKPVEVKPGVGKTQNFQAKGWNREKWEKRGKFPEIPGRVSGEVRYPRKCRVMGISSSPKDSFLSPSWNSRFLHQ